MHIAVFPGGLFVHTKLIEDNHFIRIRKIKARILSLRGHRMMYLQGGFQHEHYTITGMVTLMKLR